MKTADNRIAPGASHNRHKKAGDTGISGKNTKQKDSKISRYRAIIFDRQMKDNFEVIF